MRMLLSLSIPLLILAVLLHQIIQLPTVDLTDCIEAVTINKDTTINACSVFSSSYPEASSKFRVAASKLQAELHSLTILNEGDYTIDIAVIPGAKNGGLVVHTSGVHGVEGYAGSAIQVAAMTEHHKLLKSSQQQETERPTVIFIHAFNPFGMAHFRRTNENNVDLNRNGIRDWTTLADRHSNPDYARFDAAFNPAWKPTWLKCAGHLLKIIAYIVQNGVPLLKAAMVRAQYDKADGLFYGGNATERSYLVVEQWFKEYLQGKNFSVVTWVDVHTGLGPFGVHTLLPGMNIGTGITSVTQQDPETFRAQIERWYDSTNENLESVAQGYETVVGLTGDYFGTLFPTALFLVQEFGTVPVFINGPAMIFENAAYHYASSDEEKLWWAHHTTRPVYFPNSAQWRSKILQQGIAVLQHSMKRSATTANIDDKE